MIDEKNQIAIDQQRYEELVKKEERLHLLENAICSSFYTSDVKKTFSIEEKNDGRTS